MSLNTKRRSIVMILLVAVVAILIYGIFAMTSNSRESKSVIVIEVAPSGSDVQLDGKGIKAGSHTVSPGEHTVSATKNGFTSKSKTMGVLEGESRYVGIVLVPSSEETKNWYKKNEADGLLAEKINGSISDQVSTDITSKYPIVKYLPFLDLEFRIDYGESEKQNNDPTAIALYIRYYSETAKQDALNWIRDKGYDPNNFEIVYINTSSNQ